MAASVGPGVREKLRRANMHREDFERRLNVFRRSGGYDVVREDDVDAGERRWVLRLTRQPPFVRWGALIGDALFNYRSALDHLAFDLATANAGALTTEQESRCEFPIFHRRAPTTAELERRTGAMHPDARRLIETMQPYGRDDRQALMYLDMLHNVDKHRRLHLVVFQPKAVSHFGELPFDHVNFNPLGDGDVLASISLAKSAETDPTPQFTLGVGFINDGPGAAIPDVEMMLRWIDSHICRGVIPPLLPYL